MRGFTRIASVVLLTFLCVSACFSTEDDATALPVEKQCRVVHVYVALCDNENQGIIKVNEELGNGQDPKWNLYWGAMYGVKTFFSRSPYWEKLDIQKTDRKIILDRLAFKLKDADTPLYVIAEAYDGAYMKSTLMDFFNAAAGKGSTKIEIKDGDDAVEVECAGRRGRGLLRRTQRSDGREDVRLP